MWQPPFHPDTLAAVPPSRNPIFYGCLTAAIISCRHLLRISHSRHVTQIPQPSFHPDTSDTISPGYFSRHFTRIPQPPFHPAEIPFSPDVSQPPLYPVGTYYRYLTTAMSPGYPSRHFTWIPQPPFYPIDVPPSPNTSHPDVSQSPCHPDTSVAIPTGYLSRHSIRPTPHLPRMSHSCHSTGPISHPTFRLLRILHTRMSHSRHATRIPQPPFHPDTSAAILSGRHPTSTRMSHSHHYTRLISQPPLYPADSTHGSLALKAYQQNLYLEYYY